MPFVLDRTIQDELNLDGNLIEINIHVVFDATWKVKSVNTDGSAKMEQSIQRIQMKVESSLTGEALFDSKKEEEGTGLLWDQAGGVLKAMLKGSTTFQVSASGEVSDIELDESLLAEFDAQAEGEAGQMARFFGGGLTEDGIKLILERSVARLPVGNESTWTQTVSEIYPRRGSIETVLTFNQGGTTDHEGKKLDKLEVSSKMTFRMAEEAAEDFAFEITGQEGKGTVLFDRAAGKMIRSEFEQKRQVEISGGGRDIGRVTVEKTLLYPGTSPDEGNLGS